MVDIIPKESSESPKEISFSFYFIFSLLIFSVGCYFVLNNLLNKEKQELNLLKSGIAQIETPEKKELERELLFSENKINNFAFLSQRHLQSSNAFNLLEETAHPQVWFVKINLDSGKNNVEIFGEAQNFESLGQQIFIFEDEELINKVSLENILINDNGRINFDLILYFDSEIFEFDFSKIKPSVLDIEPDA